MREPVKILKRGGRQYLRKAIIGHTFKDVADHLIRVNRKNGFSVITKKNWILWGKSYNLEVWASQAKPGYRIDWTTLKDLGYHKKLRFQGIPYITTIGGTEVL